MKRIFLYSALSTVVLLGLPVGAWAHGGTYRGPGDTVPKGGSGAGGGGGPQGGPTSPGGPGGTSGPRGPGTGPRGGLGQPGGGVLTGDDTPDLTEWSFWWEFNKEPYLKLKAALRRDGPSSGSAGFYLGNGDRGAAKDLRRPTPEDIRGKIVPALRQALQTEKSNDIVTAALVALAKIGEERGEEGDSSLRDLITPFLKSSTQEIGETAAVALGILADPGAIDDLASLLRDDSDGRDLLGHGSEVPFRTRAFAAYGLGLIGHVANEDDRQRIVAILVDAIDSDDTSSRDLKVAAIIALGLVPLQTLEPPTPPAAGEAPDPSRSREGEIAYLRAFLADEENANLVRAHVPTALARLIQDLEGAERERFRREVASDLLPLVLKRSKGGPELSESAVLALGLVADADDDAGDAAIRKALAGVPRSQADQQARFFSLIAMAKAGSARGSGVGVDDGVGQAEDYLLGTLARGGGPSQQWAGLAIGVMDRRLDEAGLASGRSEEMKATLRAALAGEKSPSKVAAYAIGLGIARDQESRDLLLERLDSVREDVPRGYVALGLGLMGAREAIGPIRKLVRESEYRAELLRQAAIALGLLGDKHVVEELKEMLASANNLATQAAISSALGFIGDQRSIDPLIAMLQDERLTGVARAFAAVALGIVADKEDLPWNSKIAVDLNYRAATTTLTDNATGILDIL